MFNEVESCVNHKAERQPNSNHLDAHNSSLSSLNCFAPLSPVSRVTKAFRFIGCSILITFFNLVAQPATNSAPPWRIESTGPKGEIQFDLNTHVAVGTGGVRIRYAPNGIIESDITSDRARLNQKTGETVAEGDVVLRRDGEIWKSQRIEYNFNTRAIKSADFRSRTQSVLISGKGLTSELISGGTNQVYSTKSAVFTADDYSDPTVVIKAREIIIVPEKHIDFKNVSVQAGKLPLLYLPGYRHYIGTQLPDIELRPGSRGSWGQFLLGKYNFSATTNYQAGFNLDYRTKRGFAFGPEGTYQLGHLGSGQFEWYHAFDNEPGTNSLGRTIKDNRDLFRFSHRLNSSTNFLILASANYESDEYLRRDFYQGDYQANLQSRSFLEMTRYSENASLSLYAQPRLNNFYDTVERLPDLKWTGLRRQIGETPLYYESESSAGYYRRKFDYGSEAYFAGTRADTYHQILMPQNYGGWLNVTPRIGGRATYYGEAEGSGTTTGESGRFVFNTGAEFSTKTSRVFPDIKNNLFDMDGMRHIIEPSVNYAFVPKPNKRPSELPQFDYVFTSPRLLPIEYPDYNAIDQIDTQNVVRLSLRNRLQTKRNGTIEDFLDWVAYTDVRLNPEDGQGNIADLFSELQFRPRNWVNISSELRYDVDDEILRLLNNSVSFTPKSDWRYTVGQYLYLAQPSVAIADRTSSIYSSIDYKINENWSLRASHYYDAKDGHFADQSYMLFRDMRSWTAYLAVRFLKNTGGRDDDFQISFNYSLKAFPRGRSSSSINDPLRQSSR